MKPCYGTEYGHLTACPKCRYRRWCATSADLPLLANQMSHYSETLGADRNPEFQHPAELALQLPPPPPAEPTYTRNDLCQVIASLLSLDYTTLEMLDEKLHDPDVRFTELGRRVKVTRQTVYRHINNAARRIPAIRDLFGVAPKKK